MQQNQCNYILFGWIKVAIQLRQPQCKIRSLCNRSMELSSPGYPLPAAQKMAFYGAVKWKRPF